MELRMKGNPLKRLYGLGQSVWLDYIRRDILENGELQRMIETDGIRGMTSNPAIFEKAIAESTIYDNDIRAMTREGKSVHAMYEELTQKDVRRAADIFAPLYSASCGTDGYVSLEVNPHLAYDTQGTIEDARRIWAALDRPNVLIKVPATSAGVLAIEQLISEGININATLIFGLPRYRAVAFAYLSGLEARFDQGKPIRDIVSVASFFLSRIDTLLDAMSERIAAEDHSKFEAARAMQGQVAVSSAKVAYRIYKEILDSVRFKILFKNGARSQRLLWASTGNKNGEYRDLKYVESVIGPNTINTISPETMSAYRDHGISKLRLERGVPEAEQILSNLSGLDIDLNEATHQLEDEGVERFQKSFDTLLEALTDGKKE